MYTGLEGKERERQRDSEIVKSFGSWITTPSTSVLVLDSLKFCVKVLVLVAYEAIVKKITESILRNLINNL